MNPLILYPLTTYHKAVGNYVGGDIVVEVIVGMGIGMAVET